MGTVRTLLLEAERQNARDVGRFLEPQAGALAHAGSRRNVIVFGRRGSGKTSLLSKAEQNLKREGRLTSWIDVERYKSLQYPDVLLSFLDILIDDIVNQLREKQPGLLNSLFRRKKARAYRLTMTDAVGLQSFVSEHLGHDHHALRRTGIHEEEGESTRGEVGASRGPLRANLVGETRHETRRQESREAPYDKLDTLMRTQRRLHELFNRLSRDVEKETFVFIDDLYHLPRDSQPKVVDFFQGLSKDAKLFIKIGTIRHRSEWYVQGSQPVGMKLGDDANSIDLDLTLEDFANTKRFLYEVVDQIGREGGVGRLQPILTDGAQDRLVIASGGVVRDFISLLGRALEIASNRGAQKGSGQVRVEADDINHAAANLEDNKREELKKDAVGEGARLEAAFRDVRDFCVLQKKSNVFLMDMRKPTEATRLVSELVDLRLIHKIHAGITTPHKPGERFNAFMLDLSQCVNDERVIKGLEIVEFWKGGENKEKIRRSGAVYVPGAGAPKAKPTRSASKIAPNTGTTGSAKQSRLFDESAI